MWPLRVSQIFTVPVIWSVYEDKLHQAFHTIFRTCDHPFPFAVKCDTSDVACVAFECENGRGICRPDVVELDSVVASSSQEAFIW